MSRKMRVAKELAAATRRNPLEPVATGMLLLGAVIASVKAANTIERAYAIIVPKISEKLIATKIAAETYNELRQEAAAEDE